MHHEDLILASFALGMAGYLVGYRLAHTAHRSIKALACLLLLAIIQAGIIVWQRELQKTEMLRGQLSATQIAAIMREGFWFGVISNIVVLGIGAIVAVAVTREWHRLGPRRLTIALAVGLALSCLILAVVGQLPVSFREWLPSSANPLDGYWRATIGIPLMLFAFSLAFTTKSFVGTAVGISAPLILAPFSFYCTVGCDWIGITLYPIVPFLVFAAWLGSKLHRLIFRGGA